jgi:hypothetical protein
MANNLSALFSNIASAIRSKNGSSSTYYPNQMAAAISAIRTVSEAVLQSKTASPSTSQQTIQADSGYDALETVTVEAMNLQSKSVTPSTSQQTIQADSGYDALSSVIVAAASGGATVASATKSLSSNATSISFTVSGKPKAFAIITTTQISLASNRFVIAVAGDGTNIYGTYGRYASSAGTVYVSSSYFSSSYSSGTFSVTASSSTNGGYFKAGVTYRLIYVY